jgi:hypothetical protein
MVGWQVDGWQCGSGNSGRVAVAKVAVAVAVAKVAVAVGVAKVAVAIMAVAVAGVVVARMAGWQG